MSEEFLETPKENQKADLAAVSEKRTETPKKTRKKALATALAGGMTAGAWATQNGVPRRTAYDWADEPEVQSMKETIRRRAMDRAVGKLSRNALAAATGLTELASGAASESVKLSAQRAVLRDLMAVSDFNGLELRMTRIEERLRARQTSMFGPR
jgi:hypothetical protein